MHCHNCNSALCCLFLQSRVLSLYSVPLDDHHGRSTLGVCVRSVCDILDEADIEEMEQMQCMLGTSAILFIVGSSEETDEEVQLLMLCLWYFCSEGPSMVFH